MEPSSSSNKKPSFLVLLEVSLLSALLLYVGKPLFMPLGFALLISFILYPISIWLEKKRLHPILSIALPLFLLILIITGLGYLLIAHLVERFQELEGIKPRVLDATQQLTLFLAENLGLSAERQIDLIRSIANNSGSSLFKASEGTVISLSKMVFYLIMVPIFSFLILLYRSKLMHALYHFFPSESQSSLRDIITDTIHSFYNFVKGMLLVYLIVGVLNSVGLALIGAPNPFLFGFLASILTFIPYVGIMIASVLPITAVWIAYDSVWYAVAVIGWFAFVQILEAYLIFPYVVGKRLKINTLVMLIMILVGGMLWGAAGMILFIPMISIVKLITQRTPDLKFISDLLGDENDY